MEIDEHFSLISLFTFLILFLLWVSLKSQGRRLVIYTFVTLFLLLIISSEHSRPFAISFGMFSLMLLVPQWITVCLIAGGNSSFSTCHNKFSTLSPCIPQFNVSFPKNEFHTFVYLESPWINELPSNTVCMFLSVFNPDICCWCNLCHLCGSCSSSLVSLEIFSPAQILLIVQTTAIHCWFFLSSPFSIFLHPIFHLL